MANSKPRANIGKRGSLARPARPPGCHSFSGHAEFLGARRSVRAVTVNCNGSTVLARSAATTTRWSSLSRLKRPPTDGRGQPEASCASSASRDPAPGLSNIDPRSISPRRGPATRVSSSGLGGFDTSLAKADRAIMAAVRCRPQGAFAMRSQATTVERTLARRV